MLPVVLLRLAWAGFAAITKIPSEITVLFAAIINCLLVGFVLNWLLAQRIGNRNRFVTWLLSWLIFLLVYAVTLVGLGTGLEAFQISIFIALTVGILLVSFALAGLMCRKKFGPVRFSIWTAVWILLTTTLFFVGIAILQGMMTSSYTFVELLLEILMTVFIYGAILIVAILPFEIVLFANRFWRKRFDAVFGLKPKTAAVEAAAANELE